MITYHSSLIPLKQDMKSIIPAYFFGRHNKKFLVFSVRYNLKLSSQQDIDIKRTIKIKKENF